jgi:hypothetical protein
MAAAWSSDWAGALPADPSTLCPASPATLNKQGDDSGPCTITCDLRQQQQQQHPLVGSHFSLQPGAARITPPLADPLPSLCVLPHLRQQAASCCYVATHGWWRSQSRALETQQHPTCRPCAANHSGSSSSTPTRRPSLCRQGSPLSHRQQLGWNAATSTASHRGGFVPWGPSKLNAACLWPTRHAMPCCAVLCCAASAV